MNYIDYTQFDMPIEYKLMYHAPSNDWANDPRINDMARNYAKHKATCALNRKKRKAKKKSR